MKTFLFGSLSALLLATAIAPATQAQTSTPNAPRTNAPTDSGLTVPEQLQQQQQTPQGNQINRPAGQTPNAPRTNAPTDSGLTVPEQLQQQQQTPQGNPNNGTQYQQGTQQQYRGTQQQYRETQQQQYNTSPNNQRPGASQAPVRVAPQTTNQGTTNGSGRANSSGQYVPGLW
jgi:hypothetical protein